MPRYFLDSSALAKRYHQEAGSEKVDSLFGSPSNRLVISRLAIVEVHSAFARLVREGALTPQDFDALIARLNADISGAALSVAALSSPRLSEAAALLRTIGPKVGLRSLDAIHLATAQALNARSHIAAFVAADKKLIATASQVVSCTVLDVD